jgi:hypothetical protein
VQFVKRVLDRHGHRQYQERLGNPNWQSNGRY